MTLYTVLRAHGMGTLVTKPAPTLNLYRTLLQARIEHNEKLLIEQILLTKQMRSEMIADVRWYKLILSEVDVLLASDAAAAKII